MIPPFLIFLFTGERRPRFVFLELDSSGRAVLPDGFIRIMRPSARA